MDPVEWNVSRINAHRLDAAYLPVVSCVLSSKRRTLLKPDTRLRVMSPPGLGDCPLTARQLELLCAVAGGKSFVELAAEQTLAPTTISSQLHTVYRLIGARNRANAVLIAMRRGWLS